MQTRCTDGKQGFRCAICSGQWLDEAMLVRASLYISASGHTRILSLRFSKAAGAEGTLQSVSHVSVQEANRAGRNIAGASEWVRKHSAVTHAKRRRAPGSPSTPATALTTRPLHPESNPSAFLRKRVVSTQFSCHKNIQKRLGLLQCRMTRPLKSHSAPRGRTSYTQAPFAPLWQGKGAFLK